ncbi:oxygenase MpaB family protein [Actinocorallia sp. A-T 12471]|uniref:oxygenase MpaB family protein n=1 Tax=Actinocorallia sp. A-T 12471 TaxID=3089813 RepID=UPI0029CC25D4|nr:oxygenase MpaB family protein [Actinocorallia sp. A-T 12471]MDX6744243.1 oxygenase MpaB family protein [Actinocorallia sp. A-T 12471]
MGGQVVAERAEVRTFGPGSVLWEEFGLWTSAFAGQSAFLLQVMHPSIGTVVDQLSSFRRDPVGRARRSFASVQTWIYGGETAIAEGRRLREMHKDLKAVDESGTTHHALAGEPWAWVHLTGFQAAASAARYFAPDKWTDEYADRVYAEFLDLGRILQVPERLLPPTVADYRAYFDHMVEDVLVDHRVAHDVLDMMDKVPPNVPRALRPALAPLHRGVGSLGRLVATGTLPPAARDKLGLSWTPAEDRALKAVGRVISRTTPLLPERVSYMPIAYRAREAARANARLADALAHRPL